MSYETIILDKEEGIATMTLNRPAKLNAVSPAMWWELSRAIEEVRTDSEIRVLILTGTDPGFCAGADIEETLMLAVPGAEVPPRTREQMKEPVGIAGLRFAQLQKPTLAAVNGVAAGMGFSFALACDIRIASEKARFTNVFVRVGLIPDNGLTYFLPRLVGLAKALELMYTGDRVDAREAERIGLVNRVVPHDDLLKVTKDMAKRIAQAAPMALELTKWTTTRALNTDLEQTILLETYAQKVCLETEDFQEGLKAFMEKRPPVFKGV
ncbi:MAG: enoyl-CoA hydratase [Dehalococcoidia bacterium]|nr:MAG: enoyl-CoA hydratase [Dehalococcoidia bacterium]